MKYFLEQTIVDEYGAVMMKLRNKLPSILSVPHLEKIPVASPEEKPKTWIDGRKGCTVHQTMEHRTRDCPGRSGPNTTSAPSAGFMRMKQREIMSPSIAAAALGIGMPKPSASEERGESKLSKLEYLRVRNLRDENMTPLAIANETGFAIQQVNYAILAETYERYEKQYAV